MQTNVQTDFRRHPIQFPELLRVEQQNVGQQMLGRLTALVVMFGNSLKVVTDHLMHKLRR